MSKDNNNDLWVFSEGFPTIEIDMEYFKTLTPLERFKYIMSLYFSEKDLGNRLQMLDYIINTASMVSDTFIKNKEVQEYLKLIRTGSKLIGLSAALGQSFKAKQTIRNKKNDAMAKLMGFSKGQFIDETKLDVTSTMVDAFVDLTEAQMEKFGIKIENKIDDGKKGGEEEEGYKPNKVKLVGTYKDTKWGMEISSHKSSNDEDEDTNHNASCKLYYPVQMKDMSYSMLSDAISEIMIKAFAEKVDKSSNFIYLKGRKFEIKKRKDIRENIRNIDLEKISRTMRNVFRNESRRGLIMVGEPGVGKTISVHKLVNMFRDRLVFWVSADSIATPSAIRDTFKIFRLFKNSIIVLDDMDSAKLKTKDCDATQAFLQELDGTNDDLKGFIIGVVNDPQKIYSALIDRPERFDEVIDVKKPQTRIEITEIIKSKATDADYHTNEFFNDGYYDMEEDIKQMREKDETITYEEARNSWLEDHDKYLIDIDFHESKGAQEAIEEIRDENGEVVVEAKDAVPAEEPTEWELFADRILCIPQTEMSSDEVADLKKDQFTQVKVASLFKDARFNMEEDSRVIGLEELEMAYDARLNSQRASNLVNRRGKLVEGTIDLKSGSVGD